MNRKKKRIATGAAVVLAAVLAVTGTLAWQSYNQVARNGKEVIFNPGGRLHRDYDGAGARKIYVENFGEERIFARVRLDEYMEFGEDAGTAADTENREATPVWDGAKYGDESTWRTRTPGTDDGISRRQSWNVSGDKTVYVPTFNMDEDSLAADVNGTYEKDAESGERYGDYRSYSLNQEVDGTENRGKDRDGNAVTRDTVHIAAETQTATYMTMEEWLGKDEDAKVGPYWVWDEDGWFYWAEPIEPGEATGVLNVSATKNPDYDSPDRSYYSVNAVGQFVSAGDTGYGKGTGFYDTKEGTAPTGNAEGLLDIIGAELFANEIRAIDIGSNPGSTETVTIDDIEWYVLAEDKEENKALLLSKDALLFERFDPDKDNVIWRDSEIRNYLNGEWLEAHPVIQFYAKQATLYTPKYDVEYNGGGKDDRGTLYESKDSVFLLSEADVFGSSNYSELKYSIIGLSFSQYYTAGVQLTAPGGSWLANYNGTEMDWWLRSALYNTYDDNYNYKYVVAIVGDNGTGKAGLYKRNTVIENGCCVRPAFWFDLSKVH